MTPETITTPPAPTPIADDLGNPGRPWFLYFTAVTRRLGVLRDAAVGWANLVNAGRIPKVTAEGTIGESRYSESELIGLRQSAQADLAALAAVLGTDDAGLLVEVTDYAHILRWDGAAWEWGPGETGGGFVAAFAVDPTGAGWQLCDGTTVAYLKSDGTTANYATPDLVTSAADAAVLKLGDPVSGPNAATAPTFSGGSITAAATGITATTNATGTTTVIQNGAGVNVTLPSQAHVHAVNVTDPTHTHTIGAGSVGDDGEPRNMVLRPWFRR
jgi:hypothetical protein